MQIQPRPSSSIEFKDSSKKRIVILTSIGGHGHISATEALEDYLSLDFEVQSIQPLRDVFHPLDFIHKLSSKRYFSEDLYNYFLVNDQKWLIPLMKWLGEKSFNNNKKRMVSLLFEYLAPLKPDLIISVMPMINGITLDVAQQLKIPLWVIPTDLDAENFVFQIKNPSYNKFFLNLAYDNKLIRQTFESALIPESQITYAGFPIRDQFLKQYNNIEIKNKYELPHDKPIVMMLMGGLGSKEIVSYAKMLAHINTPVHLMIMIGKSEPLRSAIADINFSKKVSISVIGYTKNIAQLMAVSDILFTKSGGLTVNEALYMNIPMLIEATSKSLSWELLTRHFVEINKFGLIVKKKRELVPALEKMLRNKEDLIEYKNNIHNLKKIDPHVEIVRVAKKIIN
jgi:processive 1,2-diacylglycerol beta-glucosyltransferase